MSGLLVGAGAHGGVTMGETTEIVGEGPAFILMRAPAPGALTSIVLETDATSMVVAVVGPSTFFTAKLGNHFMGLHGNLSNSISLMEGFYEVYVVGNGPFLVRFVSPGYSGLSQVEGWQLQGARLETLPPQIASPFLSNRQGEFPYGVPVAAGFLVREDYGPAASHVRLSWQVDGHGWECYDQPNLHPGGGSKAIASMVADLPPGMVSLSATLAHVLPAHASSVEGFWIPRVLAGHPPDGEPSPLVKVFCSV